MQWYFVESVKDLVSNTYPQNELKIELTIDFVPAFDVVEEVDHSHVCRVVVVVH